MCLPSRSPLQDPPTLLPPSKFLHSKASLQCPPPPPPTHPHTHHPALCRAVLPGPQELPRPVYVAADLAHVTLSAALAGTGFDASRRTLFTCEGLIYYLPEVRGLVLLLVLLQVQGQR